MQLKKIQGYLHRAQTIVKEVRIQQVLFPVSLTRLDRVPTPSTRRTVAQRRHRRDFQTRRRPRRRRKTNEKPAGRREKRWR